MIFDLTWNMNTPQSNLMRSQAGIWAGRIRKIAALGKRAGEAGNRHGGDLIVTPRK